jgi:hypothetical protein
MALVGECIALFFAKAQRAFDQVDLLVLVAVLQLIVVRVVKGLGERIAGVEVVADAPNVPGAAANTDQQAVVPALR